MGAAGKALQAREKAAGSERAAVGASPADKHSAGPGRAAAWSSQEGGLTIDMQ